MSNERRFSIFLINFVTKTGTVFEKIILSSLFTAFIKQSITNILLKFQQHSEVILFWANFSRPKVFCLLEFRIMTNLSREEFISRNDYYF